MRINVIVPREPTGAMIDVAIGHIGGGSTFNEEDRREIAGDIYRAMLAAAPKADGMDAYTSDDMLNLISDEQARHLASSTDVSLVRARLKDILNAQLADKSRRLNPEAPKVEQEPVACPACYRGEVFGLSMDNGFWVEMGWSSGGASPAGLNGEIQLIEHHPDGKVIERVYVAKDSPAFPAPASGELLEAIAEECRRGAAGTTTQALGSLSKVEMLIRDYFAKHKGPQS